MFHDLKSLLQRSLRQKRIDEAVGAAQAVEAFRFIIVELFGEQAANNLRQVALRGDTLQIAAGTPALASEIRMREIDISRALADKVPGVNIKLKIFG